MKRLCEGYTLRCIIYDCNCIFCTCLQEKYTIIIYTLLYMHTAPLTIELTDGLKVRKLNVEKFLLCTREYGFLKFRTPELKKKQ